MSLEHVCLRTNHHGFVPIDAKTALREHPEVNRSVHGKRYLCMLCHQYVSLVCGEKQRPSFRHSRGDKIKECPDRAEAFPEYQAFQRGIHAPRIRIDVRDSYAPHFFIGLSRNLLEAFIRRERCGQSIDDFSVTIVVNGQRSFCFSGERFPQDGLADLAIGTEPPRTIEVRGQVRGRDILLPWCCESDIFHAAGAVFDEETGVLKMYDAELRLGWNYLLLTREGASPRFPGLKVERLRTYRIQGRPLYLFRISMTIEGETIPERLILYFKRFPYWLTDAPLRLRPLWPVMIRDDNELHIERQDGRSDVFFGLRALGRNSVNVFSFEGKQKICPSLDFRGEMNATGVQWAYVRTKLYQGLLTVLVGRVRALDVFYIVAEQHLGVRQPRVTPSFLVTSARGGAPVASGMTDLLPEKGHLYLTADYDHEVRVYEDGLLVQCTERHGGEPQLRVMAAEGRRIELIIGCDCVFWVMYAPKKPAEHLQNEQDARSMAVRLVQLQGNRRAREVLIDRVLIEAVKRLSRDAQFDWWWHQQMRRGYVREDVREMILAYEKKGRKHR